VGVKEPVYTVLVDSAPLNCSVSLLWFREVVVEGAILHGLGGGADARRDIVVIGLRRGTDIVNERCFGHDTKIFRDRGVCQCGVHGRAPCGCWEEGGDIVINRFGVVMGLGGGGCEIAARSCDRRLCSRSTGDICCVAGCRRLNGRSGRRSDLNH
jgi:hypothetical protein